MNNARRTGTASAAALSGLALALGLSHTLAPEWVRRVGLDVWNMDDVRTFYRAVADERKELDAGEQKMHREIEACEHLAARVAAGTVPLADATAELEPVMKNRPGFASTCATHYQVPNTRLGTARYLIQKVSEQLENDANARATLARLEADFEAMRDASAGRNGIRE